jgi:hypothetical protein
VLQAPQHGYNMLQRQVLRLRKHRKVKRVAGLVHGSASRMCTQGRFSIDALGPLQLTTKDALLTSSCLDALRPLQMTTKDVF